MRAAPRLLWLLNTEKGLAVLKTLAAEARQSIGLVSTYTDPNVREDFAAQITAFCRAEGLAHVPWRNLRSSCRALLEEHGVNGMVAVGWQYLIAEDNWSGLPYKLIVFHDSLLPRYRGFAPLATGLIKGETEFGLSVIYAGAAIDDGPILLQEKTHLGEEVYIQQAISRLSQLYCAAALRLVQGLAAGELVARPQDEDKATYSIWRNADDCAIDWRCAARQIYNLIRAVGPPYPGAFSHLDGKRVNVLRSELVDDDPQFEIRDVGKVWKIEQGRPVVVCGVGLLRLSELVDDNGASLLPFAKLRSRFV